MATSRDEVIRFIYKVSGNKELADVVKQMLSAGDAGQQAETQIKEFIDEIDRLKNTQEAVDGFRTLGAAVRDYEKQITAAKIKVAELGKQISDTEEPTKKQISSFESARSSLNKLESAQDKQRDKLTLLRSQLEANGVAVNNLVAADKNLASGINKLDYQLKSYISSIAAASEQEQKIISIRNAEDDSFRRLNAANRQAKESLDKLRQSQISQAAASRESENANNKYSKSLLNIKSLIAGFAGFSLISQSLRAVKDRLVDIFVVGNQFEIFEKRLSAAFNSAEKGKEAFEFIKKFAVDTPLELEQVTESFLQLKNYGLDPTSGVLQALVDQNAALGGSYERLQGVILAIGQAWARQKLQGQEIMQLINQGVPVWDLLTKATGKTAAELAKLSENGDLGRDVIKKLIEEIASQNLGEASKQMSALSGIVSNLKDRFTQFLDKIADSGALQYAKDQLQGLLTKVNELNRTGRLNEIAKNISDGIIAIAESIKNGITFIRDYSSELLLLARAYAVFKGASFIADLAKTAGLFKTAGEAAKASAAGVEVATGAFGRLRAKISAIPQQIQFAVLAVGVDFTLNQLEKLVDVTKEYIDTQDDLKNKQSELIQTQAGLVSKANAVAEALRDYANTTIASADELRQKSSIQADEYERQLINATRYYRALSIQAKSAGDQAGFESARSKIEQLSKALVEAQSYASDLRIEFQKGIESLGDFARQSTEKFDSLIQAGNNASAAISGIFKDVNLTTPEGLRDVSQAIEHIGIRSKEAADALKTDLIISLQSLNGEDLSKFAVNLENGFKSGIVSAQTYAQAQKAILGAALLELGFNAQQAGILITDAGEKNIELFRRVAQNAQASGDQVQLAFSKAISNAQTEGEINKLKSELDQLFSRGLIGASQYQVAVQAAGAKTAELKIEASKASSELAGMGKAGEDGAERTRAALIKLRDTAASEAGKIARLIADAISGGGDLSGVEELKARLKELESEISSYNSAISDTSASTEKLGESSASAFQTAGYSAQAAADNVRGIGNAAKDAAEEIDASSGMIQNFSFELSGYSETAIQELNNIQKAANEFRINTTSAGLESYFTALENGYARFNDSVSQARNQVTQFEDLYSNITDRQLEQLARQSGGYENLIESIKQAAQAAKDGEGALGLLDQQTLSGLISSADSAVAKIEQIAQAAQQAAQQLADINSQLQDQIDQQKGNERDIENRRFQQQLKDLEELARKSGELNSQEYRLAIARAKELHELKLKQIAEEDERRKNSNNGGSSSSKSSRSSGSGKSSSNSGESVSTGSSATTVNVNISNLTNLSPGDNRKLEDDLARMVTAGLKRIGGRSA